MKYVGPEDYADVQPLIDRTVQFGEIIGLRGSAGNAVLMSEEEYDALMETVHLMRDERVARDILEAAGEDLEESVAEEDAGW